MTKGIEFVEQGIKQYEQKIKERQLNYLHKQAKRFGLTLTPQLLECSLACRVRFSEIFIF